MRSAVKNASNPGGSSEPPTAIAVGTPGCTGTSVGAGRSDRCMAAVGLACSAHAAAAPATPLPPHAPVRLVQLYTESFHPKGRCSCVAV